MESIVHGTRGGYRVFHKTPNVPASLTGDARRVEGMDRAAIGQIAYTISIAGTGFAYSKYIIVRDVSRGAVGNIAVSVYLSAAEQMTGLDIKNLLDELLEGVKTNDEGQQHNWSFVDQLLAKYQHKIRLHKVDTFAESITKGSADPAFIYYKSEEDLCKYFETPQRKEYFPYKQVFFVDAALREQAENPLNALSHERGGDLTDKVLLDNPCYRLNGFNGKAINDVVVEIKANNKPLGNGDFIYQKDTIQICYSKEYYEPIDKSGELGEGGIANYIRVNNHTLMVEKHVSLKPESKAVQFKVEGRDGQKLDYVQFQCKHQKTGQIKLVVGNKAEFKGEEIGQPWRLTYSLNKKRGELKFVPRDASLHLLKLNVKAESSRKKSISDGWFYSILGILVASFGIIAYLLLFSDGSKEVPKISHEERVVEYTHGVELKISTLNKYKQQYCLAKGAVDSIPKPNNVGTSKSDGPFAFLSSCLRLSDNTEPASIPDLCNRINDAIKIREAINKGDINYLKGAEFTDEQQTFGEAIGLVEGSQVEAIGQKLRNLSPNLHLNAIVDSLSAWCKPAAPAEGNN